jgi:hypothetical protein
LCASTRGISLTSLKRVGARSNTRWSESCWRKKIRKKQDQPWPLCRRTR